MAEGGAEACLTSVNHYVNARHEFGDLPARFVAVVSQRHPVAGLVRADSPFVTPQDLGGRRMGGSMDNGLTRELVAGLEHLGVPSPRVVETSYSDGPAALGRGDVDVIADFADLVPRTRRQAGADVRAIRAGAPVYATGLVVADRVADDEVAHLRAALVAALEEHRKDPEAALGVLADRYPGVDPDDALEGWSYAEECIFTDVPVGAMTAEGWAATAEHVGRVHGRHVPAETLYRKKFITVT